jgi:hypothetical protein
MPETSPTHSLVTWQAHLSAAPSAGFEILAITAGEGNGWRFSPQVLQDSLPLWEGVKCFVDHRAGPRSLRDLAGVGESPHYDPQAQGIRLRLRPLGPAADLLERLGEQVLADPHPRPPLGFSADLIFTAEGRQVTRIVRVLSVDLVLDPARGGAFVRRLAAAALSTSNPLNGDAMDDPTPTPQPQPQPQSTPAPGAEVLCQHLLESALAAAHLPPVLTAQVRARFQGRTFAPAELQTALTEAHHLVASLNPAGVVQGTPRVEGMTSAEDQITAALFDLLGVERPPELRPLHVARLSGIRELYLRMTGDQDFRGGYDAERAQFATTADLPGVLKNALNKLILAEWQELGRSGYRWWEPIVSVEHFSTLHPVSGVLVGEVSALPTVAEGEAYPALSLRDSAEVGTWVKAGGYIGLTLEMFERDETHKLRQVPRKLANAALRRLSGLVAAVFTAQNGVGPQMADGYPVFEAPHHANLGSTALSASAWEAASAAIYNQRLLSPDGNGAPKLALDARYLLVPRALRLTAMRILYPTFEREANIFSENLQRGQYGDVITVPEFEDANDWAAVADPRLAPGIIIADDQHSGALFTHDEVRLKVRHWCSVFVADYRPLYKSNVAA